MILRLLTCANYLPNLFTSSFLISFLYCKTDTLSIRLTALNRFVLILHAFRRTNWGHIAKHLAAIQLYINAVSLLFLPRAFTAHHSFSTESQDVHSSLRPLLFYPN